MSRLSLVGVGAFGAIRSRVQARMGRCAYRSGDDWRIHAWLAAGRAPAVMRGWLEARIHTVGAAAWGGIADPLRFLGGWEFENQQS